jgi:hypothetical protein
VFTVVVLPVAPLLHTMMPDAHGVAVRVTVCPVQQMSLSAVIVGGAGVVPVVIVITFDTPLVPQLLLQVAVYVPATLTVMLDPLAFVLHLTVPVQPSAVNVAVSLLHKLDLLLVSIGAPGVLPVVIITAFDAPLVPQLLLQVAV